MAIVNRSLDLSQQNTVLAANYGLIATGSTLSIAQVPSPGILSDIQMAAFGSSGSPVGLFTLQRFIVGAGLTVFAFGSTFALRTFGTSGVLDAGVSLPATGSTLLNVQANDVLCLTITGSNSAVMALSVNAVLQPTQDIRSYFNGLA